MCEYCLGFPSPSNLGSNYEVSDKEVLRQYDVDLSDKGIVDELWMNWTINSNCKIKYLLV